MKNIVKYRRDLHKIPELGFKEFKTQEYIMKKLLQFGYYPKVIANSGVYLYMNKHKEQTIAIRADIDALPINEENNVDYKSTHPGVMHACGHDGHTAMLLSLAEEISLGNIKPEYNLLLIFQPAEETSGGAGQIIMEKILEQYNVSRIYAIHLMPYFEEGTIISKSGPLMASTNELTITFTGLSSHIASPANDINSLDVACMFILKTKELLKKNKTEDFVYDFGVISGGTARNIIPSSTTIEGSYRTFTKETSDKIIEVMNQVKKKLELSTNITITIENKACYPAVINDPTLYTEFKELVKENNYIELEKPFYFAEDFSFYLEKVPGIMFYLGTYSKDNDFVHPLHSCNFDFNDEILTIGVKTYKDILETKKND